MTHVKSDDKQDIHWMMECYFSFRSSRNIRMARRSRLPCRVVAALSRVPPSIRGRIVGFSWMFVRGWGQIQRSSSWLETRS